MGEVTPKPRGRPPGRKRFWPSRTCTREIRGQNPFIDPEFIKKLACDLDTSYESFSKLVGMPFSTFRSVTFERRGINSHMASVFDLVAMSLKLNGPALTFDALHGCETYTQIIQMLGALTMDNDTMEMFVKMREGRRLCALQSPA